MLLTVLLDTQTADSEEVKSLLCDGQLLHIAGILNPRWDEFSALETARSVGLSEVDWMITTDDTPGSLELTLLYSGLSPEALEERLEHMEGVDDYEIEF